MFHYFESATIYLTKRYLYGFQFLAHTNNAAVNISYRFLEGSDSQGALPPAAAQASHGNLLEMQILGPIELETVGVEPAICVLTILKRDYHAC